MTRPPVLGTQGYEAEASDLLKRYEVMPFAEAHVGLLDLVPASSGDVLDIGSGTGRDAAWFASRGARVTAIEPTRGMREGAIELHASPNITWIDDSLPDLASVRGKTFDLVWLSAVWMHFDAPMRAAMMPTVAALVRPGGGMMMSLRHGPVPEGRRMFDVGAEETIALAKPQGLEAVRVMDVESARQADVTWTKLWFTRER